MISASVVEGRIVVSGKRGQRTKWRDRFTTRGCLGSRLHRVVSCFHSSLPLLVSPPPRSLLLQRMWDGEHETKAEKQSASPSLSSTGEIIQVAALRKLNKHHHWRSVTDNAVLFAFICISLNFNVAERWRHKAAARGLTSFEPRAMRTAPPHMKVDAFWKQRR